MYKAGIISDTHGLLRPEVTGLLQGCDAILHGGDFDREEILDELERIAPVYAVRGNNDDWAALTSGGGSALQPKSGYLPETLSIELGGIRFLMTHDKKNLPENTEDYDVVICGHSHKYEEIYAGRRLMLNPGSCGPKRFILPVTMAILEINTDKSFQVARIDLDAREGIPAGRAAVKLHRRKRPDLERPVPDMKRLIGRVMRDVEKGTEIPKIANRNGISPELAEQICRLYLTHPGVDEEGIMKKMGI